MVRAVGPARAPDGGGVANKPVRILLVGAGKIGIVPG